MFLSLFAWIWKGIGWIWKGIGWIWKGIGCAILFIFLITGCRPLDKNETLHRNSQTIMVLAAW